MLFALFKLREKCLVFLSPAVTPDNFGIGLAIVGALLATSLPQDPVALTNKKGDTFFLLLLASIPPAIAHGLYDACCQHNNALLWIVGGVSILIAAGAIENSSNEKPPELQPEQQSM